MKVKMGTMFLTSFNGTVEMRILFDVKLKRPACVLLQATAGCDSHVVYGFSAETWLTFPTDDMKVYEVTPDQLKLLEKKVEENHGTRTS